MNQQLIIADCEIGFIHPPGQTEICIPDTPAPVPIDGLGMVLGLCAGITIVAMLALRSLR